jgi:hypothetical protein
MMFFTQHGRVPRCLRALLKYRLEIEREAMRFNPDAVRDRTLPIQLNGARRKSTSDTLSDHW